MVFLVKVEFSSLTFFFFFPDCLLPLETPDQICSCATDTIVVSGGKKAILIGIDGEFSVFIKKYRYFIDFVFIPDTILLLFQ